MTEVEFLDDLNRLLREGLVLVERDFTTDDDENVPRFRPTKKGQAYAAVDATTDEPAVPQHRRHA